MNREASHSGLVIDVHSHATLDLGDGRDAGTDISLDFVPPWTPETGLQLMDDVGIGMSVLSMPEAGVHFDDAENKARARRINEYLTGLATQHPTRRGAMAALPVTDIDAALDELAHALDVLDMDAVSLPTSVHDRYLGDPFFDPLFEELNRRGATVFVHPVQAKASEPLNLGLNQSLLEFPFDTTRMIANMIFSGALNRFPDIRFIASHGGGTLPFLLSRLQILEPATGAGPGRPKLSAQEIQEGAASFYYDLTAATSTAHLTALTELVPASRLLVGFDIPFMPPPTMRPALDAIRDWAGFTDEDIERILHRNAAGLFPKVAARLHEAVGTAGTVGGDA